MTKWLVAVTLVFVAGVAVAQPASEAGSAGSAVPSAPQAADNPARKACTDAMNADPAFAKSILATVDKQIDAQTLAAHQEAQEHIARNERHVVLSYAALWVIAAGFVMFLWRRQIGLRREIAQLRRDLEEAGKDGAK